MTSEWDGTPWEGRAAVIQKAVTGPGVGFYSTASPMSSFMARTPQDMMKRAQLAFHINPWIGTAEAVVTRKVVGLPWHLEDGEDEEYPDDVTGEVAAAKLLIERPQFLLPEGSRKPGTATRRLMMGLTSRHLGLCGMSHWYGDQMDTRGIPLAWLYLNPARMWAAEDNRGNLTGWVYDATGTDGNGQPVGGVPLELTEVMTFYLDPPDNGSYGSGLYERALLKSQITNLADTHAGYVLGTGGRIAGLVSPKSGTIPDEAFQNLLKEFRNVNEAPDAAKRTLILQNPVDFTPQAADPSELDLVQLAQMNRDDIFTIWGIPGSQAPIATPAGLNSGETKGYDEAILMQGAVHDRVASIVETLQYQWLDKYLPLIIEYEIEEPEFDDESPAYNRAQSARELPLTNKERRAIVGLDPTGDDAIDNAIVLPVNLAVAFTAPPENGAPVPDQPLLAPPPPPVAPFMPPPVEAKAILTPAASGLHGSLMRLRANLQRTAVPEVQQSVDKVLEEQQREIIARVTANIAHIVSHPNDDSVWWNGDKWDKKLRQALQPDLVRVAEATATHIDDLLTP